MAAPTAISGAIDTLLWRRKTRDVASTDPIVHGGMLYFPGLDGQLDIYDSRTGDRLARLHFKGPVTGLFFHDSTFAVFAPIKASGVSSCSRTIP